jgi:hypothetical protein
VCIPPAGVPQLRGHRAVTPRGPSSHFTPTPDGRLHTHTHTHNPHPDLTRSGCGIFDFSGGGAAKKVEEIHRRRRRRKKKCIAGGEGRNGFLACAQTAPIGHPTGWLRPRLPRATPVPAFCRRNFLVLVLVIQRNFVVLVRRSTTVFSFFCYPTLLATLIHLDTNDSDKRPLALPDATYHVHTDVLRNDILLRNPPGVLYPL